MGRAPPSGFLLALILVGCSPGKRETASLAAAVERFHKAENTEKPAMADFLATVPCTASDVCDAKEACVKASGSTGRALRLMAETQQGLADLEARKLSPEDERAKALSGKLDEATRLLAAGHAAMPDCDARIFQLKRGYGL